MTGVKRAEQMSKPKNRRPLVAERRAPTTRAKPKRKAKAKRPPAPRTQRRGLLWWVLAPVRWAFDLAFRTVLALTLLVSIGVGIAVIIQAQSLPPITDQIDGRVRGSVTLEDRYGQVFAWRGEQFGGVITADSVSRHLRNAIIATEDKRFRLHPGVDPIGIASAIRINLSEGRGPLSGHGGSTLSQQTAKLLCMGVPFDPQKWDSETAYESDCRSTTLARKAKEAIYAMALELRYTKDDILTIYMNRSFLGAGRGFEAAAQQYFGVSTAEVSPAQAAMLAGLLKAPTTYAPTNNLARAQRRAGLVLGLMEAQGYLTAEETAYARANPAELSQVARERAGGYFADWVMGQGPDYLTRDTTEDVVIRTTLDPRIQQATEDAITHVFDTKVRKGSKAQAAIVVMSADGAVRAMVGGRNTRASGVFNRATQALRQTGSAFKPFVYAAALETGLSPLDTVMDEPFCMSVPGSGDYCPGNYSKDFKGEVTLSEALIHSLNVPAVKVSEQVGRDIVRQIASEFGIQSDIAAGPALALGASEATLIEMTGAYAGILNGGSAVTPYGLKELRIVGDAEPLMGSSGGLRDRVIRPAAAGQLVWILKQVVDNGTGQRARIDGVEIAGKTGTSQAARDAWFIGFTGDYVAGVWMGYDDNTPLSGVTGGGLPTEIWREAMARVLDGQGSSPLPMISPVAPTVPVETPVQQPETILDLLGRILGGN